MATNHYQSPDGDAGKSAPLMICQICGVEAPTRYVSYSQNIGALLMRFHKTLSGRMCKTCVHKYFYSMTGTTLLLGWWGTISFIITPFLVLNNVGRYLFCLRMPAVPPGATAPKLDDEAVQKINAHAQELFERLNRGEKFEQVVVDVGEAARVSPAQVILYVRAVIDAQQRRSPAR